MTMTIQHPNPSVLDHLFPGRAHDFFAHYPTRPFHHAGPLRRFPAAIAELTPERIAQIYRGDIALHSADSRPVTIHSPDPETIAWLASRCDGLTFESIEQIIPELGVWCRELVELLGLPAHAARPRCNAFSSPRAAGYRFHFHYEGALLVQVHGRKRVRLAPVREPFPVYQTDSNQSFEHGFALEPRPMRAYAQFAAAGFLPPPDESEEVELAPGSVLFIPPGYWHATAAQDERSFAFSMFVAPPRLYEGFMRALELALLTQPVWREPVGPLHGPHAPSDAQLEDMRAQLARTAAALRHEDLRSCLGAGVALTAGSTLCPNPDIRWSRAPTADGAAFRIHAQQAYEFEAEQPVADVLTSLLGRMKPFTVEAAWQAASEAPRGVVLAAIELLADVGALVRTPFAIDDSVPPSTTADRGPART